VLVATLVATPCKGQVPTISHYVPMYYYNMYIGTHILTYVRRQDTHNYVRSTVASRLILTNQQLASINLPLWNKLADERGSDGEVRSTDDAGRRTEQKDGRNETKARRDNTRMTSGSFLPFRISPAH
jgi:hypothetical protein